MHYSAPGNIAAIPASERESTVDALSSEHNMPFRAITMSITKLSPQLYSPGRHAVAILPLSRVPRQ